MLPSPNNVPGYANGDAGQYRQGAPGRPVSSKNALLPLDLTLYPRSTMIQRFDNPLDRVSIPVSVPASTADGYVSGYAVPMQGKITMMIFRHLSDDSPLLLRQHYESWIASQGFERLLICEMPCKQAPQSANWRQVIDPTSRVNNGYFPDKPTYIVGFKPDAMVVVGVGEHGAHYTAVVKVVEGQVLDTAPWQAAVARRPPPPPVALATGPGRYTRPASLESTPFVQQPAFTPAQTNGQNGQAAPSASVGNPRSAAKIEDVSPENLETVLSQSSGTVVVQFTSTDPGCTHCIGANPRFETLAKARADGARFLRVMWQPYTQVFDDALAVQYGLVGLPSYVAFTNAKVVRRANGNLTAVELNRKLLAN
ncbi:MAG: thioredoxin family protein [Pseudomonadota bacterium]